MRHGIYLTESPTSVLSPKTSGTVTVAIGIAPLNLIPKKDRVINKPVLAFSEGDVSKYLGKSKYTETYGLSEVSDVFFKLYGVAPVVFINVLDPDVHKVEEVAADCEIVADKHTFEHLGILHETVEVTKTVGEATTTYVEGTDYVLTFDKDEKTVVNIIETGAIDGTFDATYSIIDPKKVDDHAIIGGEDATGNRTGLEVINDVYPKLKVVPRQLIHPGWMDSSVIAVGDAKMQSVLGTCKGMQWVDVDTSVATDYTKVAKYKADNNIIGINQIVCWPKVKLGGTKYFLSTHGAASKALIDSGNDDIPSESPSNKPLRIDGVILGDGTEVVLDQGRVNLLNGNGIVGVLDLKLWGNYTAAYSETTDVKDVMIPVRDMFNWAGVSINLTYANKIDKPGNRNLIETITDSQNIWLNGLTSAQHIYGGRVLFRAEDNPVTSLLAGKFKYKLYMSPVVPHQEMEEDMEYDPSYLETLFG